MSSRSDSPIDLRGVLGAPARQTAFVTRDIDAAMRVWADTLDIGPWSAYTLGPPRLRDMVYRGDQVSFTFRHALVMSGGMQLELVQPVEGPSIFTDHLEQFGEGMHHLGFVVPDHAAASALLLARDFTPLQSAEGFGLDGSGRFAYFEPPAGIGTTIELIDPPTVRAEPESVYPPVVDQEAHS
jgi:methylmalonyl-CoA/ethylmalonyl-CoA epimerase